MWSNPGSWRREASFSELLNDVKKTFIFREFFCIAFPQLRRPLAGRTMSLERALRFLLDG
jgi:hypothetical protein